MLDACSVKIKVLLRSCSGHMIDEMGEMPGLEAYKVSLNFVIDKF